MKIIEVLMVISGFYLNSVLPKLSQLFETHPQPLPSKEGGNIETHPQPLPSKEGGNIELQNILIISFKILFSF